jgi:DNA-binding SARP family transcriptional activator
VDFRVLGPIEVWENGQRVTVGGGRVRGLLAALLLRPNQVVSTDRLIDELWGEQPPETASTALHGFVSQLRKLLEPDRASGAVPVVLVTRSPGYLLRVESDQLDASRFERLLDQGRKALTADDFQAASDTLRQALGLWHGPAFAEVADQPFAQTEALRLEELRHLALEERIEADLILGKVGELVPELESLVAQEPLRERPRGQLMRALYASGRQAEALVVYQQARRTFLDDLGIEPGRQLQELERSILRQDPALGEVKPVRAIRLQRPTSRRRWLLAVLLALALLGISAAAIATFAFNSGKDTALAGIDPDHLGIIDPKSNAIVGEIAVGARPAAVAVGHGSVWVANAEDGTVMRIDPRTRKVVKTIGIGAPASSLAISRDAVWVGNGSAGTVSRIDPGANAVVATIDLRGPDALVPNAVQSIAAGSGGLWVAVGSRTVVKIEPASNRIVARVAVGAPPQAIAVGEGAVWVSTGAERLVRIEPDSNTVTARASIHYPVAVAAGLGGVWVNAGSISWFDPQSVSLVTTIAAGDYPIAVTTGLGSVWSVDQAGAAVYRINPNDVVHPVVIKTGNAPTDIAVGAGAVWVCVQAAG